MLGTRKKVSLLVFITLVLTATYGYMASSFLEAEGEKMRGHDEKIVAKIVEKSSLPQARLEKDQKEVRNRRVKRPHASLLGTNVYGFVYLDETGKVVVNSSLKNLFDYFLSLKGRVSDKYIKARLGEYLAERVDAGQSSYVLRLFDDYFAYKDKIKDLGMSRLDSSSEDYIQQLLEERRNLRRKMLDNSMVEGFFAEEERYEASQVLRYKAHKAFGDEKESLLEESRAALSYEQEVFREKTFSFLSYKEEKKEKKIAQMDLASFPEGAKERLLAYRRKKASFEKRVSGFDAFYKDTMKRVDLLAAEKKDEIDYYLKEYFSKEERAKIVKRKLFLPLGSVESGAF